MSSGISCTCKGPKAERMKNWSVIAYKCNYSAFSGRHYTQSEYSAIECSKCLKNWRTKAAYVEDLRHKVLENQNK